METNKRNLLEDLAIPNTNHTDNIKRFYEPADNISVEVIKSARHAVNQAVKKVTLDYTLSRIKKSHKHDAVRPLIFQAVLIMKYKKD